MSSIDAATYSKPIGINARANPNPVRPSGLTNKILLNVVQTTSVIYLLKPLASGQLSAATAFGRRKSLDTVKRSLNNFSYPLIRYAEEWKQADVISGCAAFSLCGSLTMMDRQTTFLF